jgi:hypothetical protein
MTAHSPSLAAASANIENPGTASDRFTSPALPASLTEKPREKPRLGWVLTQNKFITLPQLETALTTQQSYSKKLGELLMEQRLISEDQLRDALREQVIRSRGHWVI